MRAVVDRRDPGLARPRFMRMRPKVDLRTFTLQLPTFSYILARCGWPVTPLQSSMLLGAVRLD